MSGKPVRARFGLETEKIDRGRKPGPKEGQYAERCDPDVGHGAKEMS